MNNMRKNNNRNNNMKHRSGGGGGQGGRRYSNNGGGNSGGHRGNDGQNITRQKHHATQMREKFSNMARDAQNNGDRVDVEYYLQHVDHYTRVLTEIAAVEAERFSHQREQHVSQPVEHTASEPAGDTGGETPSGGSNSNEGEALPQSGGNQPRMTRQHQHRRQHHQPSQPQAAQDNGAAEANSNSVDIPLPGGILPQI